MCLTSLAYVHVMIELVGMLSSCVHTENMKVRGNYRHRGTTNHWPPTNPVLLSLYAISPRPSVAVLLRTK